MPRELTKFIHLKNPKGKYNPQITALIELIWVVSLVLKSLQKNKWRSGHTWSIFEGYKNTCKRQLRFFSKKNS